jgi:hypothetical protein
MRIEQISRRENISIEKLFPNAPKPHRGFTFFDCESPTENGVEGSIAYSIDMEALTGYQSVISYLFRIP